MLEANNEVAVRRTEPAADGAEVEPWQRILRDAVRDPLELATLLELPQDVVAERIDRDTAFPLLVPRGFVARMRKGDPDDPLLAQVLPKVDERLERPGYAADPLDERAFSEHGVVRKYPNRALLITTGACPIHCRYCFRRHYPYASELAAREEWRPALAALARLPATSEVILSGGDPLSLPTRRLGALLAQLEQHPGLRYVRFHTRFPITIPERIDEEFLALLARSRLQPIVVVHANHPNELDDPGVRRALHGLAGSAHALLNQSVLLRGVNDSAAVLIALSRALFECRVLPYYVHLLDRVHGAAHFEIAEERARRIIDDMRASLPGFLVPRLVRERPGELSKTLVA